MAIVRTTIIESIWESLGTFWGQFPDKDIFTQFWTIYSNIVNELFRRKVEVHLSRLLKNLNPVLSYTDITYKPIFSGDNKNTILVSGLNSLETNKLLISIPTLSGVETGQILTEGIEYQLHDRRLIQFLTVPTFDPNNIGIDNRITLYADTVYRHNPVLWGVHASGIGLEISSLDNEDYLPYNTITASGIQRTIDVASHYRYLIWSLTEMRRRSPTIDTLVRGYGISRGLAFNYRAGTITSIVNSTITIAVSGLNNINDTYVIPSGHNLAVINGQALEQFELLISGINFHDHVNDKPFIEALSFTNNFNLFSKVAFTFSSDLDTLDYNTSFHDKYVKTLMPLGLNHQSLVE